MKVQISEKYEITTDHPASHYGAGVLIDSNGNAYGPSDFIPTSHKKMFCVDIQVEAGYMVESAIRNLTVASARTEYTRAEVEQARAYLSQDPLGRFSLPPFEQLQREWKRAEKENDRENALRSPNHPRTSDAITTPKKPRGRNGGRRVEFEEGLVVLNVSIRTDQAEWLDNQPNKSASVREALDKLIKK